MAVTFNDIVQRVKQQLLGYTRDQAAISYLTQPMTTSDITFSADPDTVTALSRGLVEIGDEMMLVKRYDRVSGVATLFGTAATSRGVEATVPATHAIGDLITSDPRYPKKRIKEAINDAILGMYPSLWVFGEYEFPWQAARYEYPLPADVEQVYKVTTNTIGPSGVWFPNTSWRFNPQASVTPGQVKPTPTPTGKSLQIMRDYIVPGRNARVIYTKSPSTLNADADLLTSTGFPERYVDLITYGACFRLLPAYDAGRLQQQSIEATERAPLVPPGSANNASQYYLGLYQRRLNEERDRLFELYENYITFNG